MKYIQDDGEIELGNTVYIWQGIEGLIICYCDKSRALPKYESFLFALEIGGNYLTTGIMVNTKEYGVLHYTFSDDLTLSGRCAPFRQEVFIM